jgi:hypothetical protein
VQRHTHRDGRSTRARARPRLRRARTRRHFYELTWKLDPRRQRSWHRQLRWIGGLLAYVVALGATARALGNSAIARPAFIAVCAPISAVFYWWGQRTLLAGRVPSRSLIPGALITGAAIVHHMRDATAQAP